MPKFNYVVKDREGKTYKNLIEAPSKEALVEKLQQQSFFIVEIKEQISHSQAKKRTKQSSRGNLGKPKFKYKKVKLDDMLIFSRQLATMLEAGITLVRSLEVIHSQITSEVLYNTLDRVKKDVQQGSSLSQALGKHPKIFNQFWVSLTEVGEASGTIPVVLNKLAFYLEQQASFRQTVVSGMLYPAILFVVANGAIAFFALFVGPRFEDVFYKMGAELPWITSTLLSIFKFIKTQFVLLIFTVGGFLWALKKYVRTYNGRMQFEGFMFRMPQFGDIYKFIICERFASQMAILIDAGVPILYALDISERLVDNITCANVINDIKESVKKGEMLADPMQRSEFFPPMAIQMIRVGEETGELSKMLKHVSGFYQDIVETFMKRFATVVEPFMLVFMGGIIGTIVVAMFLPMFNLAQLGGGSK